MKAAARVDQNIERPPILRGMVVWQTALPFMAYTIGVLPRIEAQHILPTILRAHI